MKTKKLLSLAVVGVLAVGTLGASFAANPFGAADVYASLANITTEEAYAVKLENGSTFGELAEANGFYDAFSKAVLSSKLAMIQTMVDDGKITQEEADAVVAALNDCDGTKTNILKNTFGFGKQDGQGLGSGTGTGAGKNVGSNQGQGQMRRGNK